MSCFWILTRRHGTWTTTALCVATAECILVWLISVIICYLLWKHPSTKDRLPKWYLVLVCSVCLSYSLSTATQVIQSLFGIHYQYPLNNYSNDEWINTVNNKCSFNLETILSIMYIFGGITGVLPHLFIFLMYYTRIILIFRNSIYLKIILNNKKQIFFKCCVALYCILLVSETYFYATFNHSMGNLLLVLLIIIHLSVSLFLTFILIKGIKLIFLTQLQIKPETFKNNKNINTNDNDRNNGSNCKLKLKSQMTRLFGIIKRFTILNVVVTMTTLIGILIMIPINIINISQKSVNYRILYPIIINLDALINVICVGSQFTFYDFIYNIFCNKCDKYYNDRYLNTIHTQSELQTQNQPSD